ncbi:MAG TPA: DNA repair protein RadA [Longimicrobiales bacterium]|nr:DNA repair protein RadA [Longimicrobiales bacterium]
MARTRTGFFCTDCGNETARWQGQCPACGSWNTLVEEPVSATPRGADHAARSARAPAAAPVRLAEVSAADAERWQSGLEEFDFVLGGGIVPASLVLIGGEPGVGKSTLLLQVAARLQSAGRKVLYVSGEESAAQTRLRADRLLERAGEVSFLGETRLEAILAAAAHVTPAALCIDSIQTMYLDDLDGAPGSVTQVRECAARLQRFAKESGIAVFVIGHVTKGGTVAGPRTLEHIVDTVLYFEGDAGLDHRVLRATKNRFGSVDEIGVFRMTAGGLAAVANPSELFLGDRRAAAAGSAVAAVIEGTRPLLIEVQALCARTTWGTPQRVSSGIDRQRLALLLAIVERRAGMPLAEQDVFVNVVGGVRVAETASDLAVVAALLSTALDRAVPADAAFIGELGLGGEVRAVPVLERRLAEAARMGFTRVFVAERAGARDAGLPVALERVRDVRALAQALFG